MSMRGGGKLRAHIAGMAKKLSAGKVLRVGFLETSKYPGGKNVAQVAYWNEYGTKTAPPRPFFRQTIAANSGAWGAELGGLLKATSGNAAASLDRMGERIKGQVTASIVDFASPQNAPSTVKKKGFNKPLTDTGDMRNAVKYDLEGGSP